MKAIKFQLDVKKVSEFNLNAFKRFYSVYWGNKRLRIFMKTSVLILFLGINISVFAQDCLDKSYNKVLKERGCPNDDGTTKEGLFYIYYWSQDEGIHIFYFKNNICTQEQIISCYSRYEKYKNKFAGLEKKYDITVSRSRNKFSITIRNL